MRCEVEVEKLKRRHLGCQAEAKQSNGRRKFKPCLPSILMGKVRSLAKYNG